MRILYNFASRGRPIKLIGCIDNIIDKSKNSDFIILLNLDIDDKSISNKPFYDRIMSYGDKVMSVYGISKNKVDAINKNVWMIDKWGILINMSDDFYFQEEGFDMDIIENMNNLDMVLHYPDATPNGYRLMTMQIMGREYYDRQGYIYNPEYWSVYCDDEETQKAKLLGKYKFVNKILFVHRHWLFGYSKPDELNIKNDSPEMYAHDKEVFERRKKINFGIQ